MIILLVLGAAGLWLSSRLTWEWSRQLSPVRGTVVASRRGSEVAPALVPLAVIAIAAVAAVLAIGGWSRRIVGILVGVAGLAGVWTGASGLPGVFGARSNGYPLSQVVTAHLVAVLAGLLLVAAAIQIFRNTATMPHLGGSYRTPSARRRDPDADLWQALSDGRDPTGDDRTDD